MQCCIKYGLNQTALYFGTICLVFRSHPVDRSSMQAFKNQFQAAKSTFITFIFTSKKYIFSDWKHANVFEILHCFISHLVEMFKKIKKSSVTERELIKYLPKIGHILYRFFSLDISEVLKGRSRNRL